MIYFLYDPEYQNEKTAYIQEVGSYNGILVGSIDESILPYINLIDCFVLPEQVAQAYKFVGKFKGYMKIRENTPIFDQLKHLDLEPVESKFKYTFTEEDKYNAFLFSKSIMYFMLNRYYANRIRIARAIHPMFRDDSYEAEDSIMSKRQEMVEKIEACQNWEETAILLHEHFGVFDIPDKEAEPVDL